MMYQYVNEIRQGKYCYIAIVRELFYIEHMRRKKYTHRKKEK